MSRDEMSRDSKKMKLDLERIVFIGRTYSEYLAMFDLDESELAGRVILDCPAGACSLTAEGSSREYNISAADIAYQFGPDELESKGIQDLVHARERLEEARNEYVWDYYGSVEGHHKYREKALALSSEHRRQCPEKYIYAEFPKLPFADESFDLTLSAHFLFMYADRLSGQFHEESLLELMRITREEIRIFPLVDLSSNRYEELDSLIQLAASKGWLAEEMRTEYRFQRNADSYLKLTRQI
ncbi:class I SAM-dependent methyltransferase [Paenibacillus sp. YPG26]|uniref:class I SAM-dependent methyltransferase n=1 Tax=Paenibacillus sp. YPG26 TaxID=2878915 RepID=UPI00204115C3|nr:class I SAM-dependent methyltransferase [Paenibacillus sp. YPG26]USB34699.1 class I SAM-dependent methyltransferase [Paenibacillus sp. YPG26]